MADDAALLNLELPPCRQAPAAARTALTSLNGAMHLVSEARLRDALLMVSELVANAVLHGGGGDEDPVRVEVKATDEILRVAVIDSGAGFDPERLAGPSTDRGGGWGIPLVAALAHRWGVQAGNPTSVWFEIDRSQRESVVPPDTQIIAPSVRPAPQ